MTTKYKPWLWTRGKKQLIKDVMETTEENRIWTIDTSTISISRFWSLYCGYVRECPSWERNLVSAVKDIKEFFISFLQLFFKFEMKLYQNSKKYYKNSLYSLAR